MDVQSYLSRLGLESRGDPDLESLRRLHERHLLKVPFENLDIHRGVEIVLDEERIVRKIVEDGRGGFCYELNTAFAWLLRQLGFRVSLLSAEVAREDGSFGIPFDHMTLRVDLDRAYLADVGFGDCFRYPLTLDTVDEVEQLGYVYRLRQQNDWWIVDRQPEGAALFQPQYRFTLEPRKLADFASGCHYHQTSPDSTFTQKTVCSIALANGRITLQSDRLVTTRDGVKTETPIRDRDQWEKALKSHFGVIPSAQKGRPHA
jgi:N-hydroxyarylamine O-acetyltransferase